MSITAIAIAEGVRGASMLKHEIKRLWRFTDNSRVERFDRLLLVLALAYPLLVGLGLHARAHCHPGHWCSATKASQCSLFTIGRRMLDQLELTPGQAPGEVRAALSSGREKWGPVSARQLVCLKRRRTEGACCLLPPKLPCGSVWRSPAEPSGA
jgi:hypothetical protein